MIPRTLRWILSASARPSRSQDSELRNASRARGGAGSWLATALLLSSRARLPSLPARACASLVVRDLPVHGFRSFFLAAKEKTSLS